MLDEVTKTSDVVAMIRRLIELKGEGLKLLLAKKLTVLLGMIAIAVVVVVAMALVLLLTSLSLASYIGEYIGMPLSYLAVCGIVVLLTSVVWLFRRRLIFNPLSRFITRLMFEL